MKRPRAWLRKRSARWARVCCIAALTLPFHALALDRALLVGVSDYPALPKRLWLHGPINDVALMRKTLLARGLQPQNIRALVSRAAPADEPTRARITQAMQVLLQSTAQGDRIILYLSGHGSQQPQPKRRGQRPLEADGLDEVFLPADVRAWDGTGSQAAIPNALLDDEIGEWIDALVDRGATVWAVFDTCHAAGMARGDGNSGTWRAISGAELGLPAPSADRPPGPRAAPRTPLRTDGRTLAFAARSHELTGEEWLPRGADARAIRIHGVFTFHLAHAWAQGQGLDTQALEAALRAKYRQELRVGPTPVIQGVSALAWP